MLSKSSTSIQKRRPQWHHEHLPAIYRERCFLPHPSVEETQTKAALVRRHHGVCWHYWLHTIGTRRSIGPQGIRQGSLIVGQCREPALSVVHFRPI